MKSALGPGGPFERLLVGDELNEVSRGEARGKSDMPQDLNQEPGGVAARALAALQCLLGGLDAGLETDDVADVALQLAVDGDEEVDRRRWRAVDLREIVAQQRAGRQGLTERGELAGERRVVGEREYLGAGLEEKIERIDDRHVGDEIDGDGQIVGPVGKDDARKVVALGGPAANSQNAASGTGSW